MNYKERQGYTKLKVTLQQMRLMCNQGMFTEVEEPKIVYHMTDRANLKDILEDRKIKTFNDYMCFFFEDTKQIPLYLNLNGDLVGKEYHGTDGRIKKAKPLVIEDTVVLKLVPRRKETMVWYMENVSQTITEEEFGENYPIVKMMWEEFDKCRLCHYADFAFRDDSVEVLELSDIMQNVAPDIQKIIDFKTKYEAEYFK